MIKLTLLAAGRCTHPEWVVMRDGRRSRVPFPAIFALLEHPRLGPLLYDTGYTPRFYAETSRFPNSLYARVTPVEVTEGDSAVRQLQRLGLAASDIKHIIISHFHADHIGGLADFPQARFICFAEAYEAVRRLRSLNAVRAGFLPGLLPADFEQRAQPVLYENWVQLPDAYDPFQQAVDLFADGLLLAVPLPGHAFGQMGLLVRTDAGPFFLAADACWHSRAYRQLIWPHPLAHLILADPAAFRTTLTRLHHLHRQQPGLPIIPSHCLEVYQTYIAGAPRPAVIPRSY
ncbi:MAG: MBL fold metallo-hydrolase [Anaerolineae bacterium]|nr:MBL fold metallo-hydrolase [Anaerolineae bacterium]